MGIVSELALCVQAGVPVLLWGAPGVGKTATIKGIASALGLPCEPVIASVREPAATTTLTLSLTVPVSPAPSL